jgi:hypothetical protein
MSSKKFFVFKTKSGEFIGHMIPNENGLMYGLEYDTKLVGDVLHRTKDENNNDLVLIENPNTNIVSLRDFDQQYTDVTNRVKLIISDSKFSGSVAKLINGFKSAPVKTTSAKKTSAKKTPAKKTPAKKTSAKKTSAKKTSAKKGGAKNAKKKTSAKKAKKKASAKKASAKKASAKKAKEKAKKKASAKKAKKKASRK